MKRGVFRFGIVGLFLCSLAVATPHVYCQTDAPPPPLPRNLKAEAALERGYRPYLLYVENKLKHFWRPLPTHELDVVVLRFKILKNGKVKALRVHTSSQMETSDKNALGAMRIVSFVPPPVVADFDSPDFNLDVEFEFDNSATNGVGRALLLNSNGNKISPNPPPFDYGPYLQDVKRKIKQTWFPLKDHEQDKVIVAFKISKDGSVSDLKIQESSGVAISDERALQAVKHASFHHLPKYSDPELEVHITLDKPLSQNIGRD